MPEDPIPHSRPFAHDPVDQADAVFQRRLKEAYRGASPNEELVAPSGRHYLFERDPAAGLELRHTLTLPDGAWMRSVMVSPAKAQWPDHPPGVPFLPEMTISFTENSLAPGRRNIMYAPGEDETVAGLDALFARAGGKDALLARMEQVASAVGPPGTELGQSAAVTNMVGALRDTPDAEGARRELYRRFPGLRDVDLTDVIRLMKPEQEPIHLARARALSLVRQSQDAGFTIEHEEGSKGPFGTDRWRLRSNGRSREVLLTQMGPIQALSITDRPS